MADVTDAASLRPLAERTRVLATTVGPYALHGEPVVAACADTGTDYADLTGEREFVDRMWLAHHERAEATGARLVHACGFDSVPHDLGAWFTVQQLPGGRADDHRRLRPRRRRHLRRHVPLGGARVLAAAPGPGRWPTERRRTEPPPPGRRVRALPDRLRRGPGRRRAGRCPCRPSTGTVVRRSARALDRYGPDFCYGHYALLDRLPVALGAAAGLAGMVAAAQLPWVRDLLLRARSVGAGPSAEQRARSWFRVRFVGEAGGERVVTEVSGGDPGYDETALMLGESALCLALDDLPATAGQVTTVQAMGDPCRSRAPPVAGRRGTGGSADPRRSARRGGTVPRAGRRRCRAPARRRR